LSFGEDGYTALPTIYSSVGRYPLPDKLVSYNIVYIDAFVVQNSPPDKAFDADFLPLPVTVPPKVGPYKTKIDRFITPNPESVIDMVLSEATRLPPTREEHVVYLYWEAGPGLRAVVWARQFRVPETYHTNVVPTINNQPLNADYFQNNMVPTPGFDGDLVGDYLIDVESRPTTADLYEVTATYLVLDGVYT
jgi:hypothetical protein